MRNRWTCPGTRPRGIRDGYLPSCSLASAFCRGKGSPKLSPRTKWITTTRSTRHGSAVPAAGGRLVARIAGQVMPRRPTCEDLADLVARRRLHEQKTLAELATVASQQVELAGLLDALGNGLQRKLARQIADRPCDGLVVRIVLQAADESLVDLDRRDREILDVGQRRVTDAEIVDDDRYSDFIELLKDVSIPGQVFDQHLLGD